MQWDIDKLRRFMHLFSLSQKDLAKELNVPHKRISDILYGSCKINGYSAVLDVYLNAKIQGKIKEHETMIEHYKNFK